jgi:glycosyltransferase involved in cell wall biosynthesis
LEQRVHDQQLHHVKIKGHVNKQFIPYILSKSSVNILNYSQTQYNWSRGNSSNKLFEYMASAKPIISTVQMGYSIIAKYDCGIELADASAVALAEAIIRIQQMPAEAYEALGRRGRAGATDFDFRVLTDRLEHVIERVLKKMN